MTEHTHQVIQDPRNLPKKRPYPFRPLRHLNIQQFLHRQREALLIRHHRNVIQSIEIRQRLQIRLILDQLLGPTMQQPNMRIRSHNLFAIEFEN